MAEPTLKYDQRLLEDVAAVSAEFHCDKKFYDAFYNAYADQLSGFPGIWTFCSHAGRVFNQVWAKLLTKDEDDLWIESIQAFVFDILDQALGTYVTDIQNGQWLTPVATAAIQRVKAADAEMTKPRANPGCPPTPMILINVVERRKEDGTWDFFAKDDSITTFDRTCVAEGARWFPSERAAREFLATQTFHSHDKVFLYVLPVDGNWMASPPVQVRLLKRCK